MSPRTDLEFEEYSLYQEQIISETYQRPDKSYFQELRQLENPREHGQAGTQILTKAG